MEMHNAGTMNRRDMLTRALLLAGAGAALSSCDFISMGSGNKASLSKGQLGALSAIADTIVPVTDTPGALAAGVPAKLDGMLVSWASEKHKKDLIGAIDAIGKLGGGFAAQDPAKRKALLLEYDKEALKPGKPSTEKMNAFEAMMAGPPVANPEYVKLKNLIIALYYSSEIAMTKELIYEHVPGKYVASMKVTPETRPFAGLGGPF